VKLTKNTDFLKLWAGQTISSFGTMFGALALTALVYLDATPAEMGLLAAAQGLPVLLLALFAGVWVDRLRRRPIMIAADLGRAALLVTVPAAALFDALRIEQLYVVAFAVGLLDLGFDIAYRSYLPSLVGREEILASNARLQASEAVAESASPAIGGGIVQVAGGPVAVLVDAVTFVSSAAFVGSIKHTEPTPDPAGRRQVALDLTEGLAAVWRDRILRALLLAAGTFRFFGGFFAALYGVYLIQTLELSPFLMGVTVGAGGVGSFFGAFLVGPMTRRLGFGPAMVASRCAFCAAAVLIPLAGGPPELAFAIVLVAQLAGDPFWAVYEIATLSLRQSLTPQRLLGRVGSAMYVVQSGLEPVGAVVAGLLAEVIGVRETLFVAVGGMAIGISWLLFSPIPRLKALPGDVGLT
jgi:MFS family permease